MPARGAITLFRIRGIRIGVDYSWFFVLFLVIFWLSSNFKFYLGPRHDSNAYVYAVIAAFGLFSSIVLHELGHAFVAMRRGIGISDITLWMFGGVARMTRDTDSPGTEFKVAAAGPLVTLLITAVAVAVGVAAGGAHDFWKAMVMDRVADPSGPLVVVGAIAWFNAFIFVFNLIPAFPLDGGRIARAIAWRVTGDRNRATRTAATLGSWLSYLFIAVGLLDLLRGDAFGGIWLALIGWILGQSARGAIVQTEFATRIEGIRVADVMDSDPVTIPEEASVEVALDEYFLRYRWPWFFVVDTAERFRGLLDREAADAVPEVSRASSRVADVVDSGSESSLRVDFDAPLETLLANENLQRVGALAAVDAEGRLRGVITAEQVGRALRSALSAQATS
jgi:Zn-dependent protease